MEILYENEKLAIKWEYKITRHTHDSKLSRTTQHITGLSTALVNLAGIRQVLFLYKNPITNEYGLTTTEPPIEKYHTILTRNNNNQVTIQLPRELNLKENEQQNIIITYYPHEEDPYLKTKPYITIQIIDVETNESEAELVKIDDKVHDIYNVLLIFRPCISYNSSKLRHHFFLSCRICLSTLVYDLHV